MCDLGPQAGAVEKLCYEGRGVGSAQPLLSQDRVERRRSKKLLAASFVLLLTLIMHWVQDECEKEDEGWGKLWATGDTTRWCPGLKSQPPQPQSGSRTHCLIRMILIKFCLLVQSQRFYTMQEKALWYWTLIYFAKKEFWVLDVCEPWTNKWVC